MSQKTLAMLFAAWLIGGGVAAQTATLRLTTENSPPFNMMEGDKVVGRATDLVREMAERAKVTISIDLLPWVRAYNMALKDANTCVFATTRTPEREAFFKWIGPVGASEWVLYGNAERNIKLHSIEDARTLTIGTYLGDARDEYFRSRGFKVESAPDDLSNPRKLLLNRIDLWAASVVRGSLLVAQNDWTGKVVPLLAFHKVDLYMACHADVPMPLVDRLNATLQAMVRDGSTRAIEKKYSRWPLAPL